MAIARSAFGKVVEAFVAFVAFRPSKAFEATAMAVGRVADVRDTALGMTPARLAAPIRVVIPSAFLTQLTRVSNRSRRTHATPRIGIANASGSCARLAPDATRRREAPKADEASVAFEAAHAGFALALAVNRVAFLRVSRAHRIAFASRIATRTGVDVPKAVFALVALTPENPRAAHAPALGVALRVNRTALVTIATPTTVRMEIVVIIKANIASQTGDSGFATALTRRWIAPVGDLRTGWVAIAPATTGL